MPSIKTGKETIDVGVPSVNITRRQPISGAGTFAMSALDALNRALTNRKEADAAAQEEYAAQSLLKNSVREFRESVNRMEQEGTLDPASMSRLVSDANFNLTEGLANIPSKYWDKVSSQFKNAIHKEDSRYTVTREGMFSTTFDANTNEVVVQANSPQAIGGYVKKKLMESLDPVMLNNWATIAHSEGETAADQAFAPYFETQTRIILSDMELKQRKGMLDSLKVGAELDFETDRDKLVGHQKAWIQEMGARADKYVQRAKEGKIPADQLAAEFNAEYLKDFKTSNLYQALRYDYRKSDEEIMTWVNDSLKTNAEFIKESAKAKADQNKLDLLTIEKKMQQTSMWMELPFSLKQYLTLQENVQGILITDALAQNRSGANLTRMFTERMSGDLRAANLLKDIDYAERNPEFKYDPEDRANEFNSAMESAKWYLLNSFKSDGDPQYVMNPEKAVELYYRVKHSRYYQSANDRSRAEFEGAFNAVSKYVRKSARARELFDEVVEKYSVDTENALMEQ